MSVHLSGESWTIRHGDQVAEVVELGAALRRYAVGGRELFAGFAEDAKPDAGRGQVLMPWPNRIRDGKYSFNGVEQELALSEPKNHNATHGLVRWIPWTLRDSSESSVRLGLRLLAGQGWDWPLDLEVEYRLGDDGLTVRPSATNLSDAPAPFGYGAHPYLTAGETNLDETSLKVPAATQILVDERSLPTGTRGVGGDTDLRDGRSLRGVQLDVAFTDLSADDDGRWRVALTCGERRTTLWGQADTFPYVQCFTADKLPGGRARTTGLAVEPMTCAADAFNSGTHLITLEPGQTWSGEWGITGH